MIKGKLLLSLLVVVASGVAYRFGGASEPSAQAPRALSSSASAEHATNAEAEDVVLRLVDAVSEARVTMPSLDRGTLLLSVHWRKMPLAFHDVSAEGKKVTTSIALRKSDSEVAWSVPMGSGERWTPDARVWNMSEGSFDQREALFAPTPATIAFRLTPPPHARFVFSPGTANASGDATVFSVSVTDSRGSRTTPYEKRLLPEQTAHWVDDESVDLAAWAGQAIELELSTRAEPRTGDEPRRPVRRETAEDGGAPLPEATGARGLSLALWGNPEIRAREPSKAAYNVLFIVVDALRADVVASFHDDAEDEKKLSSPLPPLDALLPKLPGLTPNLDTLAARGVRFTHAYSSGSWTRPGTVAMLSGMRTTQLGVDPLPWVLPEPMAAAYYRSDPPMLPLVLRQGGVATRAFVNNYFMVGYAPVGVDMGFERVSDHRYRTKDTGEITRDAVGWLERNRTQRFFMFCNYNSPHEPLEPPTRFLDKIPDPKDGGPRDFFVRRYMAEAAKDDEAIGVLMHKLDELGLRQSTLVIVTADHGETLSTEHAGISRLDRMPVRFHHAVSNFEETTHIPILMSLPGVLPEGREIKAQVRNVDIPPTVLEVLGRDRPSKMTGLSLMPLVRGDSEEERTVVTEGRGTRAVKHGSWRAIFREGPAQTTCLHAPKRNEEPQPDDKCVTVAEELFDLDTDPGERRNVAKAHADVIDELRARLTASQKNVPVAGTQASVAPAALVKTTKTPDGSGPPRLCFRFAGAGAAHRVSGRIVFAPNTALKWDAVGAPASAIHASGGALELALTTPADGIVGVDITPTPPEADVRWELYLDDAAWPDRSVFAGPFGLFDSRVSTGLTTGEGREIAFSHTLPTIDAARDLGLFVVRQQALAHEEDVGARANAGATQEMDRLLKEWGYAHSKKQE